MKYFVFRLMQFCFTVSIFKETMMLIARSTEANHLIWVAKTKLLLMTQCAELGILDKTVSDYNYILHITDTI